jgi:hypothetical protein
MGSAWCPRLPMSFCVIGNKKMNLNDLANQVTDEKSLINFIEALSKNRKDEIEKAKETISSCSQFGSDTGGWENTEIQDYLSAAASWAEDTLNNTESYKRPDNPWTRVAHILLMGKLYE